MSVLRNPKHEIFAQQSASGKSAYESAMAAGYSKSTALTQSKRLSENVGIQSRIVEINTRIVEKAEWDAAKVLVRLGDQADADLVELQNEDGSFKPLREWPLTWRRMIQGVEVEQKSVRSTDGVQAGESKAWDKTGDRIIKIKFIDRLKNLQLLGQHKAVDAFVQQKQGDINVLVVTPDKAREIAGARQRLQRVITVQPHKKPQS